VPAAADGRISDVAQRFASARACVALAVLATVAARCGGPSGATDPANPPPQASYSKETGKLELLTFDTNRDGRTDTWNHMEGTRLVRADIDTNHDGVVDRWEYYDALARLEKVGFSRAGDGKEDAWGYATREGKVERIEVSTKRDGKIDRREFYENDTLTRAEEDADGDGAIDKWETYRNGALASVELDTQRTGKPDRRLTYGPTGVTIQTLR
jgi:hypothetical protein